MKDNKTRRQSDSFLQFLIGGIPEIEPPEDFAATVSRFTYHRSADFSHALQSIARKLVPVFLTLSIIACTLAYILTSSTPSANFEAELLFETQEVEPEITVDYVLDSLGTIESGRDGR
jgi:hypothetical protein